MVIFIYFNEKFCLFGVMLMWIYGVFVYDVGEN